jgi:hypothetical protein
MKDDQRKSTLKMMAMWALSRIRRDVRAAHLAALLTVLRVHKRDDSSV